MSSHQLDPVAGGGTEAPRSASLGATLREARVLQGLNEQEVAASLRLSPKTLEYIEAGQFDKLPGETFGRGYVRAYANLLRLDANQLVLEYDRQMGIREREKPVHGISKIESYSQSGGSGRTWLRASTAAVLIGIFALAIWWWNDNRLAESEAVARSGEYMIEDVLIDSLPLPVPLPGVRRVGLVIDEPDVQNEATTDLVAFTEDNAGAPAPAGESESVPAVAALQSPAVEAAPVPTAATVAQGLQMSFKDACWVQVSDARGQVLQSGLMQAGQTLAVDHNGPLQLVIGAVEAVNRLEYQGAQVEMPTNRSSGVVRLRLGQ